METIKINVEIEVPKGELCRANRAYRCEFLSQNICWLFDARIRDSNGLYQKCEQCLKASGEDG